MIRNLDTIAEQIVFEISKDGAGKPYPELIFNRFDKHNNCNPLIENIYIKHEYELPDKCMEFGGHTYKRWDFGGYTEQIFKPYSIEVVDHILGLLKNWNPFEHYEITDLVPVFKTKETERLKFYRFSYSSFRVSFPPNHGMPELIVFWSVYDPWIRWYDDPNIISGNYEVTLFYQMLKAYKSEVQSFNTKDAGQQATLSFEFPDE